jgi:type I restriction enzyme S subunit
MTNKPQFVGERRRVRLADACALVMGQSPSSNTYNQDGEGLPFYQGNADFGKESPVPRVWCSDPKRTADRGDVLVSVRAPIGAVNIANERCCIGRGVAAVRPNKHLITTGFLKHQLLASCKKLEAMGTGSTFKAVGKKALSDFPIFIYPEDGQTVIEGQLDWALEQLELARREVAGLDSLVKSRFVEMFETGCGKKRLIGDLVNEMHIGPFGSAMKSDVFVGKEEAACVVYEQKHAIKRSINLGWRYVDANKKSELKRFEAGPGTILVSCRGTLGRVFRLPENAPTGVIHPSLMKIEIDKSKLNGVYFSFLLEKLFLEEEARAEGSGVKMAIKAKDLAATEIEYPSIQLQEEFAAFAAQVDKSRFAG